MGSSEYSITANHPQSKELIDLEVAAGSTFVTWNGSRFDLRLLSELADIHIPNDQHVDGMLLAKMIMPELSRYSMEAMCKTLSIPMEKQEIDYDNAALTKLAKYLFNDLKITEELARKLFSAEITQRHPNSWLQALRIEQRVADIVERQVQKGVFLNESLASTYVHNCTARMQMIEDDFHNLHVHVPLTVSQLHYPPKQQFKKDGSISQHMLNYAAKYGATCGRGADGELYLSHKGTTYSLPMRQPLEMTKELTLSNQEDLKTWLMNTHKWKPTMWNYKGDKKTSPRFTDKVTGDVCPDLMRIGALVPEVNDISTWLTLRSRRNVVQSPKGTGWLPYFKEHGKIPSDADTIGANTARFTHRIIANVPRVKSYFGKPMREMLCAREGKVWVGWDATALEAICEAHWTMPYDAAYANELINGDVHTKNLNSIPLIQDRDQAKTFKYALTYGAQPKRVQQILNCTPQQATKAFDDFWANNRALAELKAHLVMEYRVTGGWIQTIDGRMIKGRSEHSLVNALLQSTGAIIMKYAMIIADHYIRNKYDDRAIGLIKYHDEEIWECDPEIAEDIRKIGCASVSAAAKKLMLAVPLLAEGKVGNNWAEIH